VARLRSEHRCDAFLLLVEDNELVSTRTGRLAEVLAAHGIELLRHPVVDMNVPGDRAAYAAMLAEVANRLRVGKSVVVACRGGLGRTGTAVACLLVDAGMDPQTAINLTRATRRNTIERGTQVEWVMSWAT
jgi:protein-tyrosine phosphatase